MIFALDINGNRKSVDETEKNNIYFCPTCSKEVFPKHCQQKTSHFAHFPKEVTGTNRGPCEDDWQYEEMTEWHRWWQGRFGADNTEVVIEHNGRKHRADVCVGRYVIEFQHSALSVTEFRKRNSFYNAAGYTVIWVFDLIEAFIDEIDEEDDYCYRWNGRRRKPFKDMDLAAEKATVFVQSGTCGKRPLKMLKTATQEFARFTTSKGNEISVEDFVKLAKKNDESVISRLETERKKINEAEKKGETYHTIRELWKNIYSWMVVENVFSNSPMYVKIAGEDGEIRCDRYDRVEGQYERLNVESNMWEPIKETFYPILDAEEKAWRLKEHHLDKWISKTFSICGKCGKRMELRTSREGKDYLACTGDPDCKETKSLRCPVCDVPLDHKPNKKGEWFWGCRNYATPVKCRFTWDPKADLRYEKEKLLGEIHTQIWEYQLSASEKTDRIEIRYADEVIETFMADEYDSLKGMEEIRKKIPEIINRQKKRLSEEKRQKEIKRQEKIKTSFEKIQSALEEEEHVRIISDPEAEKKNRGYKITFRGKVVYEGLFSDLEKEGEEDKAIKEVSKKIESHERYNQEIREAYETLERKTGTRLVHEGNRVNVLFNGECIKSFSDARFSTVYGINSLTDEICAAKKQHEDGMIREEFMKLPKEERTLRIIAKMKAENTDRVEMGGDTYYKCSVCGMIGTEKDISTIMDGIITCRVCHFKNKPRYCRDYHCNGAMELCPTKDGYVAKCTKCGKTQKI